MTSVAWSQWAALTTWAVVSAPTMLRIAGGRMPAGASLAFVAASLLFGIVRRWLDVTIALSASLLISAGLVTASELLLQAWFHDLGASFTVFLPLLAVNMIMADHAIEAPTGLASALNRSVRISIGIALTLLALGFARELVGRGSLLNGAGALLAATDKVGGLLGSVAALLDVQHGYEAAVAAA